MRLASSNYRLLPVYNVLQDQHRFICGDPCSDVLKVYDTAYPPFQLISKVDLGMPDFVLIRPVCWPGSLFNNNWTGSCVRVEKDIDNDGVNEWVYTFSGGTFIGQPEGTYYVEIQFPGDVDYFTEVFQHPGTCSGCGDYWYLEYSHSCDEKSLGDYSMNFLNKLYLGDTIMLRDGELENTIARKDGYGVETIIATDVRPKWAFEILGNSWLLDSLKFLKLYDQIYLKRSANTDVFTLRDIEVTSRGDINNDCQFPIRISFTKDALVNTKCCDSVYEQAPVPANCDGMQVMTSEDFGICLGDTVELMADIIGGAAPYVYIWSNGETGQTIEVTPTETMTVIITVVDAFGCVKQDEVVITVYACEGEMVVTITPDPAGTVCSGDSVDLDCEVTGGSGVYTYLWSTGATTQDITVTPASTTVYSVQVTDTISGDVTVKTHTVSVTNVPAISIISSGCNLSILATPSGTCEAIAYQWQIETTPGVWDPASGVNTGTTYTGTNGENYRLRISCDGCFGFSNEITVACSVQCSTAIVSVTYDDIADELSVEYATVLGSNPFINGYCEIYEAVNPNMENCALSEYTFLINVTLTTESDTLVIPYVPITFPTCLFISVSINGGECSDDGQFPLT